MKHDTVIVPISSVKPGGFFSVKSSTYGEIAFMKQSEGEPSHTRLWDAVFYDPTFGDDTAVKLLSPEAARQMANDNRQQLFPDDRSA